MGWRKFAKEYLTFTRKERIGLIVIVIVTIAIWLLPKLTTPGRSKTVYLDTSWISVAKKLQHSAENLETSSGLNDENVHEFIYDRPADAHAASQTAELFYFDPNDLSSAGWKRLGIREKTIVTIKKYLEKGGHFYKSEDLKKIYGLHADEYARLEPFVRIERKNNNPDHNYAKNEFQKEQIPNNKASDPSIDINSADTSAFIGLPGIGSKLAARIVNFREKIGGFYSIDQIREAYGLPDSVFQKIKAFLRLENISVKKININTATKEDMKSHPYLKWNLANAIVEYRNQHGNFSALEDLKKISLITDNLFEKIKFYLTL